MRTEVYDRSVVQGEPQVTCVPNLNPYEAEKARAEARKLLVDVPNLPKNTKALTLAAALSFHNLNQIQGLRGPKKDNLKARLSSKIMDLATTEISAAAENNPLPTVGIEVEVPNLPFRSHPKIYSRYANFFDIIGMPRNEDNRHMLTTEMWEFSPRPSYSAAVQSRILSELIQGGFIPSLVGSKSPQDIRAKLDEWLVSLHINIGVPSELNHEFDTVDYRKKDDLYFLGAALAVAYTSPLRLEHRKSKSFRFGNLKFDNLTPLKKGTLYGQLHRIELKAMEVATSATYRAIDTTQLLFSLLFEARKTGQGTFHEMWHELSADIRGLFNDNNYFFPNNLTNNHDDSYAISRLADRGNTAQETRHTLEAYARTVKNIIRAA